MNRGTPLGFPGPLRPPRSPDHLRVEHARLLDADLAVVDTGQSMEEVSVALVDAAVGDTILVHAKEAIAVVGGAAGDS